MKRILLILAAIAVLLIAGYTSGYRITTQGISQVGTIEIIVPNPHSLVIINSKEFTRTTAANEVVTIPSLTPGSHTVLISRPGYWPWAKEILVTSDTTQELFAFNIKQELSGVLITEADPEYHRLRFDVGKNLLPKETLPAVSENGNLSIFSRDGSLIVAEWLGEELRSFCQASDCIIPLTIFSASEETIKNIAVLPGRDDVVLFSLDNAIYALEVDTAGQNFQIIYSGTDPRFILSSTNSIIVLDGEQLMEIPL
jgi:hypothetical protein